MYLESLGCDTHANTPRAAPPEQTSPEPPASVGLTLTALHAPRYKQELKRDMTFGGASATALPPLWTVTRASGSVTHDPCVTPDTPAWVTSSPPSHGQPQRLTPLSTDTPLLRTGSVGITIGCMQPLLSAGVFQLVRVPAPLSRPPRFADALPLLQGMLYGGPAEVVYGFLFCFFFGLFMALSMVSQLA